MYGGLAFSDADQSLNRKETALVYQQDHRLPGETKNPPINARRRIMLESGLIDFYSVIDSQIGYLCWKMGEPEIRFWHEIGKGFSHRQTLPVNQQDPNNS